MKQDLGPSLERISTSCLTLKVPMAHCSCYDQYNFHEPPGPIIGLKGARAENRQQMESDMMTASVLRTHTEALNKKKNKCVQLKNKKNELV
jgi:hypothetical protein